MDIKTTPGNMLNETTFNRLVQAAADVMSVDPQRIKSKSRKRELVTARNMVIAFMRNQNVTCKTVGSFFHRDHSTVVHSMQQHNDWITYNELYKDKWTEFLMRTKGLATSRIPSGVKISPYVFPCMQNIFR